MTRESGTLKLRDRDLRGKVTCMRSSVFILLLASCSPPPSEPPLEPIMESISSRKIVDGAWYLQISLRHAVCQVQDFVLTLPARRGRGSASLSLHATC